MAKVDNVTWLTTGLSQVSIEVYLEDHANTAAITLVAPGGCDLHPTGVQNASRVTYLFTPAAPYLFDLFMVPTGNVGASMTVSQNGSVLSAQDAAGKVLNAKAGGTYGALHIMDLTAATPDNVNFTVG